MFSFFEKKYQDMAFSHLKTQHARAAVVNHLENTLNAWLDGRERLYSVRWAVKEMQSLFGEGAKLPADLIEQALRCDPDDSVARLALVTKALDLITRQRGGDHLPI